MERSGTLRRAGALALATIIGTAGVLIGAGPAAAGKRSAAGTYNASFPETAQTSKLVITNASGSTTSGTFAFQDIGDYGTWVAQGTTVAFEVAVSNSGHDNAVLIGKLTASGISPGVFGQPGVGTRSWNATRVAGAPASAVVVPHRAGHAARGARAAAGSTYSAVFDGTLHDTLTMTKDAGSKLEGTFTLTALGDTGTWAKMGKKMVFGVTSGVDLGVVMVATQTASGISTAAAPGLYYEQGSTPHPWYATKP